MIRIDAIRELRRDLHMRPFEADRRVYLILSAHLLNDDAADALLKDLEEPPPYAVIVLVADDLGPIPRDDPLALPARPVPAALGAGGARGSSTRARRSSTRSGASRSRASPPAGSTALERLLDPHAVDAPRDAARAGARRLPRAGVRAGRGGRGARSSARRERGAEAKASRGGERRRPRADGARGRAARPPRAARRRARGAARAARGARGVVPRPRRRRPSAPTAAAVHVDRIEELRADATRERLVGAERAAEAVRETWRRLEEFNLAPQLALEALFVQVAAELGG